MTAVDLNRIKSDRLYTFRRLTVFFYGRQDLFLCHRTWNLAACLGRDIGGRHRLHTGSGRGCRSTRMVDLNRYHRAILVKILD